TDSSRYREAWVGENFGDLLLVKLFVQPHKVQELRNILHTQQRVLVSHLGIVEVGMSCKDCFGLCQGSTQFMAKVVYSPVLTWRGNVRVSYRHQLEPCEVLAEATWRERSQKIERHVE